MNPLNDIGSEELVSMLERVGHKRVFQTDASIFSQGSTAEFLPIVISGRVKIFRFLEPGKEVIVNVFGPGAVFAIPPVLDGNEYPANAVALEKTQLLIILRDDFLRLLAESPEFKDFVMSRMSGLLRETTRSIKNLATASPEQRVANILIWLAEKEGGKPPVSIPLRRQDIAQIAGLATETTIRAIRKLADADLIRIVRGKVILEDPQRLRSFCEE